MTPADAQATFCATLADEWAAAGVRHAVIAPGSRSTPLALALVDHRELTVDVVHDERAAAFCALGIGVATGAPAVLLCTSGSAAANFLPAVVEAGLSAVPMLVVTADRPPELRGVGAPQTIDQLELYGSAVRWFADAPVPDAAAAGSWRPLAREAWAAAAAGGPAHLNLPFREPLIGTPRSLPGFPGQIQLTAVPDPAGEPVGGMRVDVAGDRGVLVAGGRSGVVADDVAALAAATGWPVLADPLSGCRQLDAAITAFDAILRHAPFAGAHLPDAVVRIGRPPASKVLTQWIVASGAPVVQIGGPGVIDPDHNVVAAHPADAVRAITATPAEGAWATAWSKASAAAEDAIDDVLAGQPALTEPAVARLVARQRQPGGEVVVASSMPVRDYEWYGGPDASGHANRGANGIDGVMSTALGIALTGVPTTAVVGDIAFVHDAGALTALRHRAADLRIVVVDNDGGGIFSFLPQATALAGDRFEQLFGTPHGTDVVALARAHGLDAQTATTPGELVARLTSPGPSVTRVPTNRVENVAVHAAVHAAVAAAL